MFVDQQPCGETIGSFYDAMDPESYDQMMVAIKAEDPFKMIQAISMPAPRHEDITNSTQDGFYGWLNMPRTAEIFDMGQGTGIMGKMLQEKGYSNIDGADASANFVRVAGESGWYRKTYHQFFGMGVDKLPSDWYGKYDLVVGVGVYGGGHIPKEGFDDAHALLKTGGVFIFAIRKPWFTEGDENQFYEHLQGMISTGKFEMLKDWTFTRGVENAAYSHHAVFESYMAAVRRLD